MLTIGAFLACSGLLVNAATSGVLAQDDILGDLAEENLPTTTQAEDQQAADQAAVVQYGTTAEKISRIEQSTDSGSNADLFLRIKIQQVTEKQETVPRSNRQG